MHAVITVETSWLLTAVLLSLRLGAVFLLTPVLAESGVPLRVRVLLVLALAAALTFALPGVAGAGEAITGDAGTMFRAALTELALGTTLALGIHLAFAALSVAGQLLGVQVGFGLARAMDPTSAGGVPLLASAFNQVGVLIFFAVDGHHALLRGVAYSVARFPLGAPWPLEAAYAPVVKQFAGLFTLGFSLAAPVVLCLLLVEMALGAVARSLPQMNMIAMGIPVKIAVGLVALALWFGGAGEVMARVYAGIFRTWDAIFTASAALLPLDPGGC